MKIWSQIARLGAAVAAFGPPVLTEMDDEPDRVTLPALDTGNQPVAAVSMEAREVEPEPIEVEVVGTTSTPHIAALPIDTVVPGAPVDEMHRLRGDRSKADSKPHAAARQRARTWHGGGQRYG